jgi:aldehyde dehydrogenase family protein
MEPEAKEIIANGKAADASRSSPASAHSSGCSKQDGAMTPKEAVDWLDPTSWKETTAAEKLALLRQVRENLSRHTDELVQADCEMKGIRHGDEDNIHQEGTAIQSCVLPVGGRINACIDLYESLVDGKMPGPIGIARVDAERYDVHVFPRHAKDKVLYFDRRDYLRVKGEPTQANPLEQNGGVIAVLGAGNFSSSFEMINGLFLENCAVVHKPHHLNEKSDTVWERIMKPLVDHRALSFCDANGGRALVNDRRLKQIYFTGGAPAAKAIMKSTSTEFVAECGGNNPCIIVPGDTPWTASQIEHQASVIATMAKLNGGAVCGRPQTLVTSKHWPQRRLFLDALQKALEHTTPGSSSYYPDTAEVFGSFRTAYPDARLIRPKDTVPDSEVLFIEGAEEDGFATHHEAFCQVLDEVPLNVAAEPEPFLERATAFCNDKLLGTLGCSIIIDDRSAKQHKAILGRAVTELNYGAIGVNLMPPHVWMNPYLTWGGNEEGRPLVSGSGNFGNALCFKNVEKSIAVSPFISWGHFATKNKRAWYDLSREAAKFTTHPSWGRLIAMSTVTLSGSMKSKDF